MPEVTQDKHADADDSCLGDLFAYSGRIVGNSETDPLQGGTKPC